MIVDVHSHVFPERFLAALDRVGARHGVKVETRGGERIVWSSPRQRSAIGPVFWDVAERLAALDRWGIAVQALSLSPPMLYWAPPDVGRELAAVFNDEIAAISRAHPGRFLAFATLPLQDLAAAVAEAERAARAGCRALYVGTNVNGRYLDDPSFEPLWECAVRRRLPVFTHPLNNAGEERMGEWHLGNSVGNPNETALAAARLIMAGVLDRHPDLEIVLAHGAGSLPFLLGRLDHTYAVRPEVQGALRRPPSAYLKRFHADTITHGDRALAFLIEAAGPDRVLLGTDLPYDMADPDPAGRLRRLALAPADAAAIEAGNAARLLGLEL
ncbi:MAG TPA: amidohydrolase family protein [bacterium]|nr:amidohydrolase family protein [bacterium]